MQVGECHLNTERGKQKIKKRNVFGSFFQAIFCLCLKFIINDKPNDIFILKLNTEQEYSFNETNSTNIFKFQIDENDEKYLKKYVIHIYENIGDISLYGLKCIKNSECDLDNNNIFNHFKNGNLIFSNKVNNNINLHISLDKIKEEEIYLIFPVICNQLYNKCSFNIGIYSLNDNQLEYTLKHNQDFYFKIWDINTRYIIKVDDRQLKQLNIDITFFSGKCYIEIKGQYSQQTFFQRKIMSSKYTYSIISSNPEAYTVEIRNQISSFESFYKIKYYFSEIDLPSYSLGIVTNNELCAYTLEDDQNYYIYFANNDSQMKYINDEFQNTKYFVLIYAVNCEIQIEYLNETGYIQLFEEEYDFNNSEIIKRFKIKQKEDSYSDYPRQCLIYVSSFMMNHDQYIYLHSNEKIGFKFTESIKDISFRYITIFTEDKIIKNNPYLEVIVPPSCEILLKIFIYKEYNHLLKSKKINKRENINLYEASKICTFEEECIIIAKISNFKNYSSPNENLKNNYEESATNNKDFIYIQYLNNYSPNNYIQINKVQKELSIESINENGKTYYIYQVNHETKYELFINFENQPKFLEVFVNDHSGLLKMEKNGRYILHTEDKLQLFTSLYYYIVNGPIPSFFTYYLRRINNYLEIIPNENIYGYFSEEEKYLNYVYTFEENVTSFNLEIFTKISSYKIKDITGDNQTCCNFSSNASQVIQNELINYPVNNINLKSLYKRKILITFTYDWNSENTRYIRFRILPTYFLPNIIYLNQGEEAICYPNKDNKICYFYFKVPIGYNREKIAVYGFYERMYSKILPLYIKVLNKDKISIQDFIDFYNNKERQTGHMIGNTTELLSYAYIENSDAWPDNYIIGFFETDGTTKIRFLYSISLSNDNEQKLIIYPGIKKYYTITNLNCPLKLELISKDPYTYGDYRGFLSFIKVNRKLNFLVRQNGRITKKINIEEEFSIELDKDFVNSKKEYLLSTSNDVPCSFSLVYEVKRANESLYSIVMNKPFTLYLNNYTYPLRFYMRIIENVRDLIINFKFTEQNYLSTNNTINIQDYDLNVLLADSIYIFNYLFLNEEELKKNDKNAVHDHFISDLYSIEYLTAEQIYLISFNNKNNLSDEILDKYNYIFFTLKPKDPNKSRKEKIKIQIITIRQDNHFFLPVQNKYFYSYINYPARLSNSFTLVSDSFENLFLISISSEEIKYLKINYTYQNDLILENKTENNLMQGQVIIYLFHEDIKINKVRHYLNISISLKDEYIQKNNGKNQKLYYVIKYLTKDFHSLRKSTFDSPDFKPVAEYVFNKRSTNKQNFIVEYDNVNDIIKSRWSIILNKTYQFSYVEARYYLRFFDTSKVDNEQYNLSIFPRKLEENIKLLSYVTSEENNKKVDDKEFNYKVLLLAYFEDELGEEFIIVYKPQTVSHELKYFWFWILGVILVLALFIFFSVLNLCLKIKEEKDYYENDKDKEQTLKSFSSDEINKEEEDFIKLD